MSMTLYYYVGWFATTTKSRAKHKEDEFNYAMVYAYKNMDESMHIEQIGDLIVWLPNKGDVGITLGDGEPEGIMCIGDDKPFLREFRKEIDMLTLDFEGLDIRSGIVPYVM